MNVILVIVDSKLIYIIVEPDRYYYGDRTIQRVFSTKEKAISFINENKDENYEIDEYELQ